MTGKHSSPKPPGEVVSPPPPTPGEDVNVALITRFGVGLLVLLVLVTALLIVFMRALAGREKRADAPVPALAQHEPGRAPAGVRLQEEPFGDLEKRRRLDAQRLESDYSWTDEKEGRVRIPIDVAMRLLVRRGLPVRGAVTPSPEPTERPTPSPRATRKPRPKPRATATLAASAAPPAEPQP
jgi:hypothetical protein